MKEKWQRGKSLMEKVEEGVHYGKGKEEEGK